MDDQLKYEHDNQAPPTGPAGAASRYLRAGLIALAVVLALAVAGVLWARDSRSTGVRVRAYGPQDALRGAEPLRVQFSAAMVAESATAHLHIDPPVAGAVTWDGADTLVFTPDQVWVPGQTYRVRVAAGAASRGGATLESALQWEVAAGLPRVVYLAPADAYAPSLYLADLQNGTREPLTTSEHGIEEYAVSPDGTQIAYTRNNEDNSADIWLLDVASGTDRPLTACVSARCTRPAWKPDASEIMYQREDFTGDSTWGLSAPRPWIVDVATVESRLLFDDTQQLGAAPAWSPDGTRIALYDPRAGGIRVYSSTVEPELSINTGAETPGVFSPDGARLLYPVLVRGLIGQAFYTHLEMMTFETGARAHVSGDEDAAVDDSFASWSPDGRSLVVARRYLDTRYTTGRQLYLLDVASGSAAPLVVDAQYTHAAPQWDASGRRIVYQRFDLESPGAEPEIWTYDTVTQRAVKVTDNGFLPAWVN